MSDDTSPPVFPYLLSFGIFLALCPVVATVLDGLLRCTPVPDWLGDRYPGFQIALTLLLVWRIRGRAWIP